jgi:hypothetical protein
MAMVMPVIEHDFDGDMCMFQGKGHDGMNEDLGKLECEDSFETVDLDFLHTPEQNTGWIKKCDLQAEQRIG